MEFIFLLLIRSLNYLNLKKNNFKVIGSTHNSTEIYEKIKQGCTTIFLSRLFKVSYKNEKDFLGLINSILLIKVS